MLNVPRHVAKPWGFEIWWAVTDSYAGKILHIEQGARLSVQYHEYKDESCYVLSGLIRLRIGKTVEELSLARDRPGGLLASATGRHPCARGGRDERGARGVHAGTRRRRASA